MNDSQPPDRRWLKWSAIFGIWTVFGFFFASQLALQNQLSENPVSFWRILSWQLFSGYVWFVFTPLILWLGNRFRFEDGGWRSSVPIHIAASFAIAFVQLAVDAWVLPQLGYLRRFQPATFWDTFKIFLLVNLHFSIAIYWAVLSINEAIRYYRKYRERTLRTSQLEARLAESRLQVLKMQLHPHFLFNTLNAVSELIHRDPDAAERMIGDLSDLLRMSLDNLEIQEIPLSQELEFLQKYLDIEQMRFHDRLTVRMEIDPAALDSAVPNMILQPLVENAIKHGIGPRTSGGTVEIAAERSNGSLRLRVSDNGIGLPFGDVAQLTEGVGISNTRRRLRHLYGADHDFRIIADGGVRIELTLPAN